MYLISLINGIYSESEPMESLSKEINMVRQKRIHFFHSYRALDRKSVLYKKCGLIWFLKV